MLVAAHTPDGQTLAAPLGSHIRFGPDEAVAIESINDCGGAYTEVGRQLRIDVANCTRIAAPASEDLVTFLALFDRLFPYSLHDGVLTLTAYGQGTRYHLVFYPSEG